MRTFSKHNSVGAKRSFLWCMALSIFLFSGLNMSSARADEGIASTSELQQTRVTGKIVDANGESLPGVSIMVKGTTTGTITDMDGNYSISASSSRDVLQFSSIGFLTQEIVIGNQSQINVTLAEDVQTLDEVVVIGYGSMKKSDVTGSVTSVDAEDMMKRVPISVTQGLQGMAAGVVITQSSGDPSGSYNIRIRGVATMDGSTSPLWVVDGVQHGNTSNLSWLNPNEVESIEILKDASATAIYGSRGANGVIMVTTKRGQEGNIRVNLQADFGISTYSDKLDMADLNTWLGAYRQSLEIDKREPFAAFAKEYDGRLNYIDWQDVMTQNSFRQQYNLSLSGGTKDLQATASINYMDNKGLIVNSWNKRLLLNMNVQGNIKNIVRLGFTTNFSTSKNKGGGNMLDYARLTPTMDYVDPATGELLNIPVQYPDGTFGHFIFDTTVTMTGGKYATNPYADQYIRKYKDDWDNDNGSTRNSAWIEVNILKGLTFRSTANLNFSGSNSWSYNSPYISNQYQYDVHDRLDEFSTSGSASTNTGIENYLTYNFQKNDHRFTLMAGQSASKSHGSSNGSSTKSLTFPFLRGFYSTDSNLYNNGSGGPSISSRFLSYFGRFNYTFKDRYMVTATIRKDGSSNFGSGKRWGTFPSASLAWRASEEEFIKDLGIFSNLKVRAGWGQTGNANASITDAIPQLSTGVSYDYFDANNDYSQIVGLSQSREIDQFLHWEASEQTNVGLDLGFLNNQLNITLDYYVRNTEDLILSKAIRPSAGYSSIKTNFGSIRNSGFEFSINYNKRINSDWSYSVTLNGSTNKNKAIDIGAGTTSSGPTGAGWDNKQVCYSGLPLGTYQGYVVDHIIKDQAEIDALNAAAVAIYGTGSYYDKKDTGPGDFLFKDLDGDGHITTKDVTYLGDGFPDLNFGLNLQARYRNWDASAYIYGVLGQKLLSWAKNYMTRLGNDGNSGYFNLLSDYAKNSWTPENPNSKYPKLSQTDAVSNYRISDYYVEKADYLKISNFQIGYTFDKRILGNTFSSARVYASVQNLLTISPYKKFGDPEVNSGVTTTGYDQGKYPLPRTFMFGVQVGF